MGAKQTKIEDTYLPETPPSTAIRRISAVPELKRSLPTPEYDLDPRSPNGCRTPISLFYPLTVVPKEKELDLYQQHTHTNFTDNPLGMLRKRFLKGFIYNLHDPRSPSTQLNRTPLVYDAAVDKTLNLDDTFADLFVETHTPTEKSVATFIGNDETVSTQHPDVTKDEMQVDDKDNNKETITAVAAEELLASDSSGTELYSLVYYEEETMPCPAVLQQTPPILLPLDPRSPSIGLERTPIIFSDDDEGGEEAMLENILARLSLDLSKTSSVCSFSPPTCSGNSLSPRPNLPNKLMATNKHLERVRVGKKHLPPRKLTRVQRQRIYQDCENVVTAPSSSTKQKSNGGNMEIGSDSGHKRTPLSCVKNRPHFRSRSVETSSAKTLKTRLSLTSFDDSLNPVQNAKVANLRIMRDSQESL